MENCFVKDFKVGTNNDNLPIYDKFEIVLKPSVFRFSISIPVGESISWDNAIDDITAGYSGDEQIVTSPFISTDAGRSIFISGTLTIKTKFTISTKYQITKFNIIDTTGEYEKITSIDYCTKLKEFNIADGHTYLRVNKFPSININNLVSIERFVTNATIANFLGTLPNAFPQVVEYSLYIGNNKSASVLGQLNTFYNAVNATLIDLRYTKITGEIKTLVENLAPNKNTGNLTIRLQGSTVTFNGETPTYTMIIEFNSSTVVVKNNSTSTVVATYNKGTGVWS